MAFASSSGASANVARAGRSRSGTVGCRPPAPASAAGRQPGRGRPKAEWPGASREACSAVRVTRVSARPSGRQISAWISSS
nr:hypothetical protein [Nonomuraea aridisoli]